MRGRDGIGWVRRCGRAIGGSSSWPARALAGWGFSDVGAMWRAGYDMPADDFAREADRIWEQVKPLYLSLHAYVRPGCRTLRRYPGSAGREDPGPPAGKQAPDGEDDPLGRPGAVPRRTISLQAAGSQGLDARGMAKAAEHFYTSLGFAPLPPTFWTRSLFVKPRPRGGLSRQRLGRGQQGRPPDQHASK